VPAELVRNPESSYRISQRRGHRVASIWALDAPDQLARLGDPPGKTFIETYRSDIAYKLKHSVHKVCVPNPHIAHFPERAQRCKRCISADYLPGTQFAVPLSAS
jgi:hypothetical protein